MHTVSDIEEPGTNGGYHSFTFTIKTKGKTRYFRNG